MLIRSLLGLAALLAGTSCVPALRTPTRAAGIAPIDPGQAQLLRRLALTPPPAGPDAALPPWFGRITPRAGAPAFPGAAIDGDIAARAVDCLTAAVYYEARSEPLDGQRAVAQIVLNRVRDRAFPASVCGVVYQHSAGTCQFSFACDGSMDAPRDRRAWALAAAIARAAFDGAVYAPVGAATHFHTAAISPWWAPSLARIGQIGAHVFYAWRGAMTNAFTFRRGYAGIEPGLPIAYRDGPAALADDSATVEQGVAIHRGTASGVRVHRGTDDASVAMIAQIGPEIDERPPTPDPI